MKTSKIKTASKDIFCRGDNSMSLNNVYYWNNGSWKKITAEAFVKKNPDIKVAAKAKLFWCETCGQYVTLANGEKRSYFRHSSTEEIKNCEDRAQNFNKHNWINSLKPVHNLPLKIFVEENNFYFKIGLIRLPQQLFNKVKNCQITIQAEEKILNRSDLSDFLLEKSITWIYAGDFPAKNYSLELDSEIEGLNFYWTEKIQGIDSHGTLFDSANGRKILCDSDIKVNTKYFLLTSEEIFFTSKGVEIKLLLHKNISFGRNYFLYEVEAQELSESAAKFFLNYHYRLTAEPISIQPIYPVFIQDDDIVHCDSEKMFFYFFGNVETKFFPNVQNHCWSPQEDNFKVIETELTDRPQMLAIGRLQLLQYLYLWKDLTTQEIELPKVEVKDLNNQIIEGGIYYKLPKNSTLQIYTEFDCQIIVNENNVVEKKFFVKSGDFFNVSEIKFGYEIKILYGLDCVWSVNYERAEKGNAQADEELFFKLERGRGRQIKIPHTWGSIGGKLKNFPKVKNWLYKSIRKGFVNEESYLTFKQFILNF